MGAKHLLVVPTDKRQWVPTKYRKLHLNIGKNFFMVRMIKPWNRLPRDAVEISLDISKSD